MRHFCQAHLAAGRDWMELQQAKGEREHPSVRRLSIGQRRRPREVFFRCLDWQLNRKRRSLIRFAFYPDRSAEQFDEDLHDVKTESDPSVHASR